MVKLFRLLKSLKWDLPIGSFLSFKKFTRKYNIVFVHFKKVIELPKSKKWILQNYITFFFNITCLFDNQIFKFKFKFS